MYDKKYVMKLGREGGGRENYSPSLMGKWAVSHFSIKRTNIKIWSVTDESVHQRTKGSLLWSLSR